jgi:lipid II isoglutaminyl synthase (glutamine-hydrolysing)
LVVGTNGKTTTVAMISHVLTQQGYRVLSNSSGANLMNGIASSIIKHTSWQGTLKADIAVLEVDENALPFLLSSITSSYLVALNLFRDQLDRYGEVDSIRSRWHKAIEEAPPLTLILNGEDPAISFLGEDSKHQAIYFGLGELSTSARGSHEVSDSAFCAGCGEKLFFKNIHYSHIGSWICPSCGRKMPDLQQTSEHLASVLPGLFNLANVVAVYTLLQQLSITPKEIAISLSEFEAVFGRGEILSWGEDRLQLYLAKNPTGFNETLRLISDEHKHTSILLIALNDNIPDGIDISWIWDVDFEHYLPHFSTIVVTGTRAWDMAVRVEYAAGNPLAPDHIQEEIGSALAFLKQHSTDDLMPVVATYSAMLLVRQEIQGRALL